MSEDAPKNYVCMSFGWKSAHVCEFFVKLCVQICISWQKQSSQQPGHLQLDCTYFLIELNQLLYVSPVLCLCVHFFLPTRCPLLVLYSSRMCCIHFSLISFEHSLVSTPIGRVDPIARTMKFIITSFSVHIHRGFILANQFVANDSFEKKFFYLNVNVFYNNS